MFLSGTECCRTGGVTDRSATVQLQQACKRITVFRFNLDTLYTTFKLNKQTALKHINEQFLQTFNNLPPFLPLADGLEVQGSLFRTPAGVRTVSFTSVQTDSGTYPVYYPMGTG